MGIACMCPGPSCAREVQEITIVLQYMAGLSQSVTDTCSHNPSSLLLLTQYTEQQVENAHHNIVVYRAIIIKNVCIYTYIYNIYIHNTDKTIKGMRIETVDTPSVQHTTEGSTKGVIIILDNTICRSLNIRT